MSSRRSARLIATYVLSLVVTVGLLVLWVIYVLLSASTITELAQRAGSTSDTPYWSVLWSGVVLFMLVIGGLTFQLALALGARNYSRKQEEFVSNITHEMKSPLAAIQLHAQTLQQGDVTEDERQRSVAYILQQAHRMGTLVDNVLESSRLISRKRSTHVEPVELAPFLRSFFQEVRGHTEGRGVRLTVDVGTAAVVLGTAESLRRVMTNLMDNAIRFSSKGGEVRWKTTASGFRRRSCRRCSTGSIRSARRSPRAGAAPASGCPSCSAWSGR
jgi:signal transduction histidine kinase